MKQMFGIGAIIYSLLATSATAADFKVVGLSGTDSVFVWRDKAAHNEGLSLIAAGVHKSNPAMMMSLLACIVPSGSEAIVTDMGFATHDIMIISGENAGCRGNIPTESLKSTR